MWDWTTSSSNYTTLRAEHEAALGGKGWEIESSIDVNVASLTSTLVSGDGSEDYLPTATKPAIDVRDDDINTLLFGQSNPTVRITRIRSDLSHAAMTQDLILQASADQTS